MEVRPGGLSQRAGPPAFVVEARINGVALLTAVATHRDRSAFARLFAFYAPRVRAQLLGRGAPSPLADDLTQEVMLTVWLKAGQFDGSKAQVGTWLYAITRNCFINSHRQRWPVPDDQPPSSAAAPEQLLLGAERQKLVQDAIGTLPAEQRAVLAGAYSRGRTLRELAHESGIPLGTVKSRVRLAMARLRDLLEGTSQNDDV